ncbi:grpE protein homolog 1, mitochondrial-like [Ptychodera flava]|uniref:grpE protein homolog 1, mitochondrial-like n=1 Tax=Ptychodera flava TaxID=63121 RepID=UPI003969F08E
MRIKFMSPKVISNMAAMSVRAWVSSRLFCRVSSVQFARSPKFGLRCLTTETNAAESKAETQATAENTEVNQVEKELQEEKQKLQKQLDEITDKYKRSLAETENVRIRHRKQLDETRVYAIQGFCKDLLEVADILHTATESVPKDEVDKNSHLKSLFEGLKMTESQLLKVFKNRGLTTIDPLGEKFDPNQHEALFTLPAPDKEAGTVAVVTKIGYKFHDRTLRPALVGVATKP